MIRSVVRRPLAFRVAAVAVPALIVSAAVAVPLSASAASGSPTAASVLALVAKEKVSAFSGTVTQKSDLGLPSLPTTGSGSNADASSALDLLTGSHTVRIYVDGSSKQRVQVLDQLAERDLIRNGTDVWTYNSKGRAVTHLTLAAKSSKTPSTTPGSAMTPEQLASKFLAATKSTSTVALGKNGSVAGRTTYTLVLTPKSTGTLFGKATVSVDTKTGMPLAVAVSAAGQKTPAFSVGFTKVDFATPDASLFSFTPPAGAKVTEKTAPSHTATTAPPTTKPRDTTSHTVVGSGWASVVVIPPSDKLSSVTSQPLFSKVTTAVTGGRLFHTALVNVLVATDGRVLVGSVSAARLEAVASTGK